MRLRLPFKITLIYVFLLSGILFGIYWSLNGTLQQTSLHRTQGDLTLKTEWARRYLEDNPVSLDFDRVADRLGQELQARVTLMDFSGKVLGDSQIAREDISFVENHTLRPEVQEALQKGWGTARRFSVTIKKDLLYRSTLFQAGSEKGIVRLAVALDEVKAISGHIRRSLLLSLGWGLLAFAFLGATAVLFVSRPIREILIGAKRMASGTSPKRLRIYTQDELQDLAEAFNDMAEQVEQRIVQEQWERSRLQAVLLGMFDGVLVVDKRGTVLLINHTLRDILGIKGDPVGKKLFEVVRPMEIQDLVTQTLESKKGVLSAEIVIGLDEEKSFLIHATPIEHDQAPQAVVLVMHDITQLRRLEKVRRDFVANVSHELRTPIANVKGYAETLLAGALDDKDNAADFLKIIYDNAQRLSKLVDDLLHLSQIESDKLELHRKPCQIRHIIDKAILGLTPQITEKELKISVHLPDTGGDILANEDMLVQVIWNLLENAIKYTPAAGKIDIRVTCAASEMSLEVADTGVGIPEEDLPRLFERFYRVDKSRSRDLGGTGLGLSIVKHIIQLHGGDVFVQSRLGEGSVFGFKLPQA